MPPLKVPGRRVQPELLPAATRGVAQGAGDFGGLEADVIGQIGRQVAGVGEAALKAEERQRVFTAKVDEARFKRQEDFKNRRDKLLANDALITFKDNIRNQRQVYLERRGINAFGVTDEANQFIEDLKKDAKKTMENDEQRLLFDSATGASRELFLNNALSHEASEFNKAEDAANDARIDFALKDAMDAVGSNNEGPAIDSAKNNLDTAIKLKAEKAGMTGVAAKNVKDELVSVFHEGILNQMVVDDAERAKEYYDKHIKEIVPENREGIEKILNQEDIKQSSKEKADEIQIKTDDAAEWIPTARREIKDAEKLDATIKRLNTRKEELDQLEVENIAKVNDNILGSILNAQSKEEAEGHAFNAPTNGDIKKHLKTVEWRWKEKKGEPIVSPEQMMTPEYNDLLDDAFINVAVGKYKSIGQLRHDTLGSLSKEDQKDVEDFWKKGALIGGINMSELRSVYKSFSGLDPQENRLAWNSSLRYIQRRVATLPPGKQNIEDIQLNNWMEQSVIKTADQGIIFKDRGKTFAQLEELGEEFGVDVEIEMTTQETDFVTSLMEKGNKERIAAGLEPWPINEVTIKRGFMNVIGAERIRRPATPIISPITGGTLRQVTPPPEAVKVTPTTVAPPGINLKELTGEEFTRFSPKNVNIIHKALEERTGGKVQREIAEELLKKEIIGKPEPTVKEPKIKEPEKALSFEEFRSQELDKLIEESGGTALIKRLGIKKVEENIKRDFDKLFGKGAE